MILTEEWLQYSLSEETFSQQETIVDLNRTLSDGIEIANAEILDGHVFS